MDPPPRTLRGLTPSSAGRSPPDPQWPFLFWLSLHWFLCCLLNGVAAPGWRGFDQPGLNDGRGRCTVSLCSGESTEGDSRASERVECRQALEAEGDSPRDSGAENQGPIQNRQVLGKFCNTKGPRSRRERRLTRTSGTVLFLVGRRKAEMRQPISGWATLQQAPRRCRLESTPASHS